MFIDAQTNWPDVANKVVDKLSSATAAAAEKLGDVAPKVWEAAVFQTKLRGIESGIVAMLALVAFVIAMVGAVKIFHCGDPMEDTQYSRRYNRDGEWTAGAIIVGVICGGASGAAFLCFFIDFVNYTFNPAYWTAVELLNKLQGK